MTQSRRLDYLDELNEVQRQAVTHIDGPVMVIAGPGSGKTRVLTYRIAYLIDSGIPPWQVLALTFTNKAAKEMKERIERVVGRKAQYIWAGTFHSIFARILRVEAEKIGYTSNFTIYDTDDTKSLISSIIKEMELDRNAYNVGSVRTRISSAKSNVISPIVYAKSPDLMEQDRQNRMPMLYKIYEKYVARCHRAGAMDFDDLLYQLFKLLYLNKDNVRQKYQQQFQYILVDEFQDTNYLQYSILKLLTDYEGSSRNICVVGDDAQSIYAFRGATLQNIFDYQEDYPELAVYKLEQNYRSTQFIVKAANKIITHNKKQINKDLWTELDGGQKIQLIKAMSDTEEGRRVADTIVEYKNRHNLASHEIAILYRTNAQSRVFEEFLRRYNIPYRIFGGLSFYQRKEVKDLIAYLRLAINPKDDEAFRRVINYPKRGIGQSSFDAIANQANAQEISYWEAVQQVELGARTANSVKDFARIVLEANRMAQTQNAYEVVSHLAKTSGIMGQLKAENSIEGLARLENVNALLDGVQEFVENDEVIEGQDVQDKSLAAYLQQISLLTDMDEDTKQTEYVSLMSVHAAKGLEFKAVFVVGLEENLFPSFMSLSSPEQIEEERRLFYVAVTRAKEMLTLSYANSRYQFGQMRFNDPSRFLDELDEEVLDGGTHLRGQQQGGFPEPKVLGGLFPKPPKLSFVPKIDPATFQAADPSTIQAGMKVLHLKFGEGQVQRVDGERDKRVATIVFPQVDNPERRIMLKFAKLQIL
ncbi:MAG: UvrD-helicase domain-containing protein [Saprospiraceae bacterium]|nr:UvrD-helicase domain-containing protein [Saprospiraceae bacterium]